MIVPLDLRQAAPTANTARSNLIAVASGKGGVGKTWFSITLAHALALAGKKALLFDGDLGLANVDVQLGVTPKRDLGTFLAGQTTLGETASRYAPGGFDIIAGRSGSGSLAQVAPSRLAALRSDLQILSTQYDYVIMDMGAGIERTVRSFATQAKFCFVVTTDEPTAITDAYAFIKVTTMERPNADMRLELGGIIRRDVHVRESIRKQTSLMTRFPNSEAAADIQAIISKLRSGR